MMIYPLKCLDCLFNQLIENSLFHPKGRLVVVNRPIIFSLKIIKKAYITIK